MLIIFLFGSYGGWGYQASWGAALQAKKVSALVSTTKSIFDPLIEPLQLMEEALSLTSVPHPRL